jgi:cytochrome c-type biogenesis protein CcmH
VEATARYAIDYDSDDQAVGFVRARYGDFVLLRPPFKLDTWLLWGGPALILLIGVSLPV